MSILCAFIRFFNIFFFFRFFSFDRAGSVFERFPRARPRQHGDTSSGSCGYTAVIIASSSSSSPSSSSAIYYILCTFARRNKNNASSVKMSPRITPNGFVVCARVSVGGSSARIVNALRLLHSRPVLRRLICCAVVWPGGATTRE